MDARDVALDVRITQISRNARTTFHIIVLYVCKSFWLYVKPCEGRRTTHEHKKIYVHGAHFGNAIKQNIINVFQFIESFFGRQSRIRVEVRVTDTG